MIELTKLRVGQQKISMSTFNLAQTLKDFIATFNQEI